MALTPYQVAFIHIVSVLLENGLNLWYLLRLKEDLNSLSCCPIEAGYIGPPNFGLLDFLMACEEALNPTPPNRLVTTVLLGNPSSEFIDLYAHWREP